MTDQYAELRAAAEAATPGPWFAGPLKPEDHYGAPGGVSVGPFDLAERYGRRADYTPDTFNCHHEDQIALVSGCNHDAEANAAFIALANPETINALLSERDALAERVRVLEGALKPFVAHYPMGVNPSLDDAYRSARAALSPSPLVEGGR
jgi:hypothetical protein